MTLTTPIKSLDFQVDNIYGQTIKLSEFRGKAVVLTFFRDISCPFCNHRAFELSQKVQRWRASGVEVIAVYSSRPGEIREFVSKNPRGLHIVGDPKLEVYRQYDVQHSLWGVLKTLIFKMPTVIRGFNNGGRATMNPNARILPADFLIDPNGVIRDAWYSDNASAHMPMDRLEKFVSKMSKVNFIRESFMRAA